MPGIDIEVACLKLAIDPEAKPVSQKKWKMAREKRQVAREETSKLLKVGFVKEINTPLGYPMWF